MALEGQPARPLRMWTKGAGWGQWRWAGRRWGQCYLSSLVPTALVVLARHPMPEPSICADRSRHGACKNIPQGAIWSRHPLGEQGCQSHGRECATASDKQTPTHAAPTLDF